MTGTRRAFRIVVAAAALSLIIGCQATYRNHGYVPNDADLARIAVGESDRAAVAREIGQPTSEGLLNAGGWYYVRSRYRHFAYRKPEEIDREVLAVSFNEAGTVSNIERFGLEEGRVLVLSRRVTDSNIEGVSLLRQLFGNIGNVDAGQFFDDG